MRKFTIGMAMLALAGATTQIASSPAVAQEAQAEAYSVSTTPVGTLLDDPEAAAILERLIPTVYDNDMFRTMGRPQTLQAVQQYEAAVLTDEKLAEIQAAFDQLASD